MYNLGNNNSYLIYFKIIQILYTVPMKNRQFIMNSREKNLRFKSSLKSFS